MPRFRAAYDLLLLRENSGEQLDGLSQWWTDFQNANTEAQSEMLNGLDKIDKPRRSRRKKPNKPRKERSGNES
jgi:poly(A) polymerase